MLEADPPKLMVLPAVAEMPVAPATAPFCVRSLAAFMVTLPPLEFTLPLSTMLPVLVMLVAAKLMLPVADTPPAPTVSGLLAVMETWPPVAFTAPWVTTPPVLFTVIPPSAVVSCTRSSAPVLVRSIWPVPVTLPAKLLNWCS